MSGSASINLEAYLECHLFGSIPEGLDLIASYPARMRSNAVQIARQETTSTNDFVRRYEECCLDFLCLRDETLAASNTIKEIDAYTAELEAKSQFHLMNPRKRYGCRFFATKAGRLGWVPQAAISGDEICVLLGYAMPFVVRKIVNEEVNETGTHQFIGACYVHGFMDGEVFLDETLPRTMLRIA